MENAGDIDAMTAEQARVQLVMNYTNHLSSCCSRGGRPAVSADVACNCGLFKLVALAAYEPVNYPGGNLSFRSNLHPKAPEA